MRICVIGTGYIGLVTGSCFAEMGNLVTCVDSDEKKIADLQQGHIPIFEPGLELLVSKNHKEGRLKFTTSLAEALVDIEVIFIAVGTPPRKDGSIDLDQVFAAANEIGELINGHAIIVVKSTVPVGTTEKVADVIGKVLARRKVTINFDVVSNPEFLKEGAAVNDFMRPDRVVIGSSNEKAIDVMRRLYAHFIWNHDRLLVMKTRDAEMTKYAANAMLATRISFMNEMAVLCERIGANVENVRKGIGADTRIGYSFIYPGCGYGGSCFPKDVRSLMRMGEENGVPMTILEMVDRRNDSQKRWLFEKVINRFGPTLKGHDFCVWGLSFKPETDDIREAPSLVLVKLLIEAGARVVAFDPVAANNFRRAVPQDWLQQGRLALVDDQYEALRGASALLLVTEWRQFRNPELARMKQMLKKQIIFDGRNQYDPEVLHAQGFEYHSIGR